MHDSCQESMLNKFGEVVEVGLVTETLVITMDPDLHAPLSFFLSFFIEHKRIVDDGIFPNERGKGKDW